MEVVAAPTGSGKTLVMEMCVMRLLGRNVGDDGRYVARSGGMKVIYIAPTRSLVQERVRDWSERFGNVLGTKVTELTGDIENVQSREMDEADVICATPEKFDAVSRKYQNHGGTRFFGDIALVLIDEVHLLNETRGSVLEAGVVSRIRVVSKLTSMRNFGISKVRFVAVSATVPNAEDLATWLDVPSPGLMVYGEEVRPVQLRTVVKGYNETKNDFLFERRLNDYLYPVIAEYSKRRPTLVFCSTRKGTAETAQYLIKESTQHFPTRIGNPFVRDAFHLERLMAASKKASNKQLQQCLVCGIAFHHAGMDAEDRTLVETSFLHQDILILCTTGTLAMGVNLPAHLVVIKGTRYYCGNQENGLDHNGYREYERGMCLQMIGRAGRPQFDTEGFAVIMTQRQHVQRYENLAMGCEELESQLKSCFAEYLNAEIVLGTIKSIPLAVEWLKSTFMYIRARKNPVLYGMPMGIRSREEFDQLMQEKLIVSNLLILQKHKMVRTEEGSQEGLMALECGRLMAYYYIRMNTMIRITETPSHTSIPDLIQIISRAEELETIRLRRNEKKALNDINCRRTNPSIKFQVLDGNQSGKVKQRISASDEKIFILLNDALSETASESMDVSLRQETTQILKVAETIARCMSKYYASVHALAASANARILLKCVKARLWDGSSLQSKQLPNIGKLLSERLAKASLGKLRQLIQADPRKIEAVTMKHYPFGNTLLQDLQHRMPPEVDLHLLPQDVCSDGKVKVQVVLERRHEGSLCQDQFMASALVCGTLHNDSLLINQSINLKTFQSPYIVYVYVERGSMRQKPIEVVASVILEKLVGMDVTKRLVIPFNFKPEQWTKSEPAVQDKCSQQELKQTKEDAANNGNGVIQRLSAVAELQEEADDRALTELQTSPPPETVSHPVMEQHAHTNSTTSGEVHKHTRQFSGSKFNIDESKCVEGQSLSPGKLLETEIMFKVASNSVGSFEKENYVLDCPSGKSSSRRGQGVLVPRHDSNKQQTSDATGVGQEERGHHKWRTCLSNAQLSPNRSKLNETVSSPVSVTIRHLRQMEQRPNMDWSAKARAIIEARKAPAQRHCTSATGDPTSQSLISIEVQTHHSFPDKGVAESSSIVDQQSAKKLTPVKRRLSVTPTRESKKTIDCVKESEVEAVSTPELKDCHERDLSESETTSVFSFL